MLACCQLSLPLKGFVGSLAQVSHRLRKRIDSGKDGYFECVDGEVRLVGRTEDSVGFAEP